MSIHYLIQFQNKKKNDLHELLGKAIHVYINDDKLNYYIPFEKIEFQQDTKDKVFFFFKNVFIEISKDSCQFKPYSILEGSIWRTQIIEHDIKLLSNNEFELIDNFVFAKFLKNICTIKEPNRIFDKLRYDSLICTIGYLLHNHKTTSNKLAVILSESNLDIEKVKGGTGKGLIMQSVGKIRKVITIDGKNFTFNSQFAFQNVELDTHS